MSDMRCINLGYVVPKDQADQVQAVFKKHSAWMENFYSDVNNGPDHLISSFLHEQMSLLIQWILVKE